jgi:hypothetical protein
MEDKPYHNDADMKTKREMLTQDRAASTYFEQATGNVGAELGGRFQHLSRGQQHIVGQSPNAYPALPANNPWSSNVVPDEEPLGYSVNDMPPVGGPPETGHYPSAADIEPPSDAPSRAPTRHFYRRI